MKKVLWLASWYPNDQEPFSGDFIKRQAEAVSIYRSLNVLYVGKYSPGTSPVKSVNSNSADLAGNLKEHILFYPPWESGFPFISKFKSLYDYIKKHLEFFKQLRVKNEMPELVHVHIAMKAGIVALYLKWKYKIPYVLTEHWTGYYPQAKDSLNKKSFIYKYLTRQILKNAARFLPVSEDLGNYIHDNWKSVSFQKIPNVVNTRKFFPALNQTSNIFRFIHISTLSYQKNPQGIIRSFIELLNQGFHAELVLVGPRTDSLLNFIHISGGAGKIICLGEISYEEVGIELRKSNVLVMFSFYENMPCTILEALCTGIPVIATRVGGIPEVIRAENGILINAGNENELLRAMKEMIGNHQFYNKDKISQPAVAQFSYETIGREINQVYEEVLKQG